MIETIIGYLLLNVLLIVGLSILLGIIGVILTKIKRKGYADFDEYIFGFMFPFVFFMIVNFFVSVIIWTAYWAHYLLGWVYGKVL